MVYLDITSPTGAKDFAGGAAVAPTQIKPVIPPPPDFDDFWKAKIESLQQIPPNPQLTPVDIGNPKIDYFTIQMDHVNGTHVYGQLAKPKGEGKFPALVIFQYASPPYPLEKGWVTRPASQGWLVLNIEPHNVLPEEAKSYYKGLPTRIKKYELIGQTDRDKNYFVEMYLRDYRAVEYIASRPDWDGKTLVVMGASMGGQQSLAVAGLNPRVTHLIVEEPAGCDLNGPFHHRKSGYPFYPSDPAVMETAQYIDPINFASKIKATCLVSMGFIDTIAPPAGVWTAYNEIQGPKEVVPLIEAPHNNIATQEEQLPYYQGSAQWLDTLVKGGEITPKPLAESSMRNAADQPTPRTDENSLIAHVQLMEKARKGGIDVYFLGDSIVRRWGCSDPMYASYYANWKKNFWGWNAADFGWGGDSIQNILWRVDNGELDRVNPKVIVILAGTNNVGNEPGGETKIADITKGMQALVKICRQKAPNATIILTAIFPRNDNMAVIPEINRVNDNLAKMADGKTIRFLNVNDKLADSSGKLYPGMMNPSDRLHPALKGYQVWADGLKPILTELLGPPAITDHAPPPTGDPKLLQTPK
jgi:cephalosporin-C deacetylase